MLSFPLAVKAVTIDLDGTHLAVERVPFGREVVDRVGLDHAGGPRLGPADGTQQGPRGAQQPLLALADEHPVLFTALREDKLGQISLATTSYTPAELIKDPTPLQVFHDNGIRAEIVSKREGEPYRRARKARWGEFVDIAAAIVVAAVVVILVLTNPRIDTLLVGGAAIAGLASRNLGKAAVAGGVGAAGDGVPELHRFLKANVSLAQVALADNDSVAAKDLGRKLARWGASQRKAVVTLVVPPKIDVVTRTSSMWVSHSFDQRLFWDETNWAPACKRCHDAKTAREGRWG